MVGATWKTANFSDIAAFDSNFIASLTTYYNVPLIAFSVQNEPDGCFSYTGTSTGLSGADFDSFIKNSLGPKLVAAGQTSTKIMMPETSIYSQLADYAQPCMGDPSCANYVGIVAFHDYDNAQVISNPYSSQLWETETSGFVGGGPSLNGGYWDPSIANAVFWAKIVHTNMVGGVSAFHYFWFVDPLNENTDSALINPSQSIPIAIRTYAIAQWAKFVRPGWVRIDATANPENGIDITAFKNSSSGDFAIVAVNENTSGSSVNFSLNGLTSAAVTPYVTSATLSVSPQSTVPVSGNSFTYALPAQSITTFVGSGSRPPAPSNLTGKVQ